MTTLNDVTFSEGSHACVMYLAFSHESFEKTLRCCHAYRTRYVHFQHHDINPAVDNRDMVWIKVIPYKPEGSRYPFAPGPRQVMFYAHYIATERNGVLIVHKQHKIDSAVPSFVKQLQITIF